MSLKSKSPLNIEDRLAKSEEKYRELVESVNSIILRWDAEGRITFMNSFGLKFFGYSEEELIGRNVMGTIVPETESFSGRDLDAMIKDIRRHPEKYKNNQNENICKDGSRVWISWTNKPVFGENGQKIEILSIGNDLTELKMAEGALRTEHRRLERLNMELKASRDYVMQLIGSSLDMIIAVDKDRRIIEFNPAAEKNLGYSAEEVIGRPVTMLYQNSQDSDAVAESIGKTGQFAGEIVNKKKDGEAMHTYLSASALLDGEGNHIGVMGISRDITEMKRLAKSFHDQHSLYHALIKAQSDVDEGVIIIQDGRIIFSNDAVCRMTGYALDEIESLKSFIELVHPNDRERVAANHARRLAGEQFENRYEIALLIKSGERLDAEIAVAPTRLGEKTAIVVALKDITERKRFEEALRTAKEELEAKVEERTTELKIVNEQLKLEIAERLALEMEAARARHLASIGELAAGVAHEINNPINGIINYAQLLSNKTGMMSKERDIAGRIIKEGNRIAGIVSSLLTFARERKEEKIHARIHEILSDTLALTEALMRKDGINLKITVPHSLPMVFVNPQQIQQVFLNVINNARYALNQKYPDNHGGKIFEITGEEVSPNIVSVVFLDHGAGIPNAVMDKIMEPFFSTKPAGRGTGLGLSISHGIITEHGGKLMIESKEGEFTKIEIMLPTARPE
jgi:PAS domain S-box-containing protein